MNPLHQVTTIRRKLNNHVVEIIHDGNLVEDARVYNQHEWELNRSGGRITTNELIRLLAYWDACTDRWEQIPNRI